MQQMTDTRAGRLFRLAREGDERVAPIELILDVVFVLAFSEITAYLVGDESWLGIVHAVIILALLWRGWFAFAWLTSISDPNSCAVRVALFTAMAAFMVMALVIPEAAGDHTTGEQHRPLAYWFVGAYAVIRVVHVFLGWRASRGKPDLQGAMFRTAIGGALAVGLLLGGCVAADSPFSHHALWVLAVLADYSFRFVFSRFGWRLVAGHFAERHGLIVIIALGETILAAGVAAEDADKTDPPTLVLAMVAVALLSSLWGAYFDGTETASERALVQASGGLEQNTLACRAYSLLHFPIVLGAVLVALGPHCAVAQPNEPFTPHIAAAFFGGLMLFLLGQVGFVYLTTGWLNVPRVVVGLMMAPLIVFGMFLPSWESVVLAASITCVMVFVQRCMWARSRDPEAIADWTTTPQLIHS